MEDSAWQCAVVQKRKSPMRVQKFTFLVRRLWKIFTRDCSWRIHALHNYKPDLTNTSLVLVVNVVAIPPVVYTYSSSTIYLALCNAAVSY